MKQAVTFKHQSGRKRWGEEGLLRLTDAMVINGIYATGTELVSEFNPDGRSIFSESCTIFVDEEPRNAHYVLMAAVLADKFFKCGTVHITEPLTGNWREVNLKVKL
jgi:hypothetical protein